MNNINDDHFFFRKQDCTIEYIENNQEATYCEWVNPFLSLQRNHVTNKIVGFDISHLDILIKKAMQTEKEINNLTEEEQQKIYELILKEMNNTKIAD